MFAFDAPQRRRRPSLTPMIDVVFLLLVFFMLAARFGGDEALPLATAGGGEAYSGPPRLVDVLPEGLRLNGSAIAPEALVADLGELTDAPEELVVLRPGPATELQRVVSVMERLEDAGFSRLVLVE